VAKKEYFKKVKEKVYYEVTLKGALAALCNKEAPLGNVLERLRVKLHIPEKHLKAVKPIALLWAYRESRLPKHLRGKIDEVSIMNSVRETYAACQGVGVFSILREDLGIPQALRTPSELNAFLKEKFEISDEEHIALRMFFSAALQFLSSSYELYKRTLEFAEYLTPTSYLSDLIEILPNFGIRIFLAPFKEVNVNVDQKADVPDWIDTLRWMNVHKNIAELVSEGKEERLHRYLLEALPKLQLFWLPICFSRHLDGICSILNEKCPHESPFSCEIVRKNAERYKKYIDEIVKKLIRTKQL
jgi:hypothetical protein